MIRLPLPFRSISLRIHEKSPMRLLSAAMAVILIVGFAGVSQAGPRTNSVAGPTSLTLSAAENDKGRCRCLEYRWNGSCKRRVCRDHW